jgi:hypothetical protein
MIVLVDQDATFASRSARWLEQQGYSVVSCTELEELDAMELPETPRGIALDVCPHGRPQIGLIRVARLQYPAAVLVALTEYPSVSLSVEALREVASACRVGIHEPHPAFFGRQFVGGRSRSRGPALDATAQAQEGAPGLVAHKRQTKGSSLTRVPSAD